MGLAPFTKLTNFCTNIAIKKKSDSSITWTLSKEWGSQPMKILPWDISTTKMPWKNLKLNMTKPSSPETKCSKSNIHKAAKWQSWTLCSRTSLICPKANGTCWQKQFQKISRLLTGKQWSRKWLFKQFQPAQWFMTRTTCSQWAISTTKNFSLTRKIK